MPGGRLPNIAGKERVLDLIEVDGLRLRCVIGCKPEERRDCSDVVVALKVGTDARSAGASDDLADAWDYRAAVKAVITEVEKSECFTIEALAARIARVLVCGQKAPYAQVRVSKPGALRFADTVSIVIDRTAADFAGAKDQA